MKKIGERQRKTEHDMTLSLSLFPFRSKEYCINVCTFQYLVRAGGGQRFSVGSWSHTGSLDPTESYSVVADLPLSETLPTGTYDISLRVDDNGRVFEHTGKQNNIQMAAIEVVQKLPDLEVSNLQATIEIDFVNEVSVVRVSWTTRNIGQGRTRSRSWHDAVYVSDTEDQWRGLRLGSRVYSAPIDGLEPREEYSIVQDFILPPQQFGNKFIHVYVDNTNTQVEATADIDTNIKHFQISVPARTSQLGVTRAILSTFTSTETTTLFAGQKLTVTWNVTNNGNWSTVDGFWTDSVYLSKENEVSKVAALLGTAVRGGGMLKPGEEYGASLNAQLPETFVGNAYILIVAAGTLWEIQDSDDRVQAIAITVEEPPKPELKVESVTVTRNPRGNSPSGQLVEVTWTVVNEGNNMVDPRTWNDAVVLIPRGGSLTDPEARVLETFPSTGQLDFQQRYTVTKTVLVGPSVPSGSFFVSIIPEFTGILSFPVSVCCVLCQFHRLQNFPCSACKLSGVLSATEEIVEGDRTTPIVVPQRPKPEVTVEYNGGIPNPVGAGVEVTVRIYRPG